MEDEIDPKRASISQSSESLTSVVSPPPEVEVRFASFLSTVLDLACVTVFAPPNFHGLFVARTADPRVMLSFPRSEFFRQQLS